MIGYVRGVKKVEQARVYLSFDEWNVWYREMNPDGGWKPAPHLAEEVYNLEDALVCAQYLNSFVRHADTVKMACLAQIVNVIAPILTNKSGLLIQSIYYPFIAFSQHARGRSLKPIVSGPNVKAGERGDIPALDVSASHDPATGALTAFIVNRSQTTPIDATLRIDWSPRHRHRRRRTTRRQRSQTVQFLDKSQRHHSHHRPSENHRHRRPASSTSQPRICMYTNRPDRTLVGAGWPTSERSERWVAPRQEAIGQNQSVRKIPTLARVPRLPQSQRAVQRQRRCVSKGCAAGATTGTAAPRVLQP